MVLNPVLALIITNIIWGAASPVFKLSLQNIPPFVLAFLRFFGASIIFIPLAMHHWQKVTVKQLFWICLGAFFAITVNIGFFFLGLSRTESINAPVIASSQPIFLYLISIFFLKEKPHRRVFWGILVSFIGVLIIIFSPFLLNGSLAPSSKTAALEGNLFLVIATLAVVVQTVVFKKVMKEVNVYVATFISFVFGSVSFIPPMFFELQKWSWASLDYRGWIGIVFGAVFSSAVAYACFNYGISKIDAQEVGIFSYIDPVVAVFLAIPLVHEFPTLPFYIGTYFVFAGIILAEGRVHWHPFHKLKAHRPKFKEAAQNPSLSYNPNVDT